MSSPPPGGPAEVFVFAYLLERAHWLIIFALLGIASLLLGRRDSNLAWALDFGNWTNEGRWEGPSEGKWNKPRRYRKRKSMSIVVSASMRRLRSLTVVCCLSADATGWSLLSSRIFIGRNAVHAAQWVCDWSFSLSLSALLNLLFPFSTNKRDVGAARSRRRRGGICLAFRCVNTRASCSLVSARAKQRKYGRRQEQPREIYVEPEQISSLY